MKKETIEVVQRPETDRNGDYPPPQPGVLIRGCTVWPRAAEEKDGGEVAIDGENVAAPDNAVARTIQTEDWVMIRGELHQIDEPPSRYIGKRVMLKTKRVRT